MNHYRFEFYMIEPITLIPSSLLSVTWRALRQYTILPWNEQSVEALTQRRMGSIAANMVLKLIFIPLMANSFATSVIFTPIAEQLWHQQPDIYLHAYLQKQAFDEYDDYSNLLYFDCFLTTPDSVPDSVTPGMIANTNHSHPISEPPTSSCYSSSSNCSLLHCNSNTCSYSPTYHEFQSQPIAYTNLEQKLQRKMFELSSKYNQKSIDTIVTVFGDGLIMFLFFAICFTSSAQMFLLKAVIFEILASVHDITRSVMLIFTVNLLVGYHSPRGWELFLQMLIDRGNWPLGETFILFVVGTLPVILDTCMKYWIFRYLNKSLPTTVVTYHRMIS